jgi:hypothetical protein
MSSQAGRHCHTKGMHLRANFVTETKFLETIKIQKRRKYK